MTTGRDPVEGGQLEGTLVRAGFDFGEIRSADGRRTLRFGLAAWEPPEPGKPILGYANWTVVYEEAESGGRVTAARVRPVRPPPGVVPDATPEAKDRRRPSLPAVLRSFLLPYNFVRPLPEPDPSRLRRGSVDVQLLGRCAPPPHDRYVALSGVIECRIETVGSVFVADSHEVGAQPGVEDHFRYQFFRKRVDGTELPCIPGSSLRGVIRGVFEALTASCWEHVHADRRLSRRYAAEATEFVPGRIVRHGSDWRFEVLSGTTGWQPRIELRHYQYAAWVRSYGHPPASGGPPYRTRPVPAVPSGLGHGDECWAHIQPIQRPTNPRLRFWNVVALDPVVGGVGAAAPAPRNGATQVVCGWFVPTGRNVDRKHDERVFFRQGPPETAELANDAPLRDYLELLADQRDNVRRNPPDRGFVVTHTLRHGPRTFEHLDGHLCYARIEREGPRLVVRSLGPVSLPRQEYRSTIRERFPRRPGGKPIEAVLPCSERAWHDPDHPLSLCPACRTFGWVRSSGDDPDRLRPVAFRGRVLFSDAVFHDGAPVPGELTLPVLASPKPTTVRFYLLRSRDVFDDGRQLAPTVRGGDDREIDYDADMTLRGRKFYRAHRPAAAATPKGNQNRTLVEALPAGRAAGFRIRFHNLAPVELGALLWALELRPGLVQRLGYAKPLGYGAVRIRVSRLGFDTVGRYTGAASAIEGTDAVPLLRKRFERAMMDRHGFCRFDGLPNVSDLLSLLDGGVMTSGARPPLPVRYPEFRDEHGKLTDGYVWFMLNKGLPTKAGTTRLRDGKGHWLHVADHDPGLPDDPRSD